MGNCGKEGEIPSATEETEDFFPLGIPFLLEVLPFFPAALGTSFDIKYERFSDLASPYLQQPPVHA